MAIPPLKNNCFAMPPGVAWTPVDEAVKQIKSGLHPVVEEEIIPLDLASGRATSKPIKANRNNPPLANSAVDGFGFSHDSLPDEEVIEMPLQSGVSAAGKPFDGAVQGGYALRILTGAILPEGIDTVVLEEDTVITDTTVAFRKGLRKGANMRHAAEDVGVGDAIFETGHVLRPQDIALLAATAVHEVAVYKRLKVAVISTGTELVEVGYTARDDQTFDANKPMLLNMLRSWGFEAIDGGHFRDEPSLIRSGLCQAAQKADAIFVSGGASAGDEDYVSKLLSEEGTLHTWRVAVKPGRPIAMALWDGTPTFGFPGNPVAAFVCALIFGYPALKTLAGQNAEPVKSYQVPAGFEKAKKEGRREYLRARIASNGQVETFKSEGSGRISGLTWSDGLVELPDDAMNVALGDMVTYIPYTSFGL